MFTGYLWYFFGIFAYFETKKILNINEYGIIIMCFICSLILFVLPVNYFFKKNKITLILFMLLMINGIIYFEYSELIITLKKLHSLMFMGTGLWGNDWYYISFSMAFVLINMFAHYCFNFNKVKEYTNLLFCVISW